MPGLMIHLILAKKTNLTDNPIFYLGNIAPDAVTDWKTKDKTHLRTLENREPALLELKNNSTNDFSLGMLLHLFLDWKWDIQIRDEFIKKTGENWFVLYRNELAISSSYAFNTTDWAKAIWNDIDTIPINDYGKVPGATSLEVKNFLHLHHIWHKENILNQSKYFSKNLIEEFTDKVASEFLSWIK